MLFVGGYSYILFGCRVPMHASQFRFVRGLTPLPHLVLHLLSRCDLFERLYPKSLLARLRVVSPK